MSLSIAVTGSNGYVGGRLAAALTAAGHDVTGLVRNPVTGERRFVLGEPLAPDLLAGLDVLIHCAWDMRAHTAAQVQATNVEGSHALLAAARAAGVKRILFISTMSAFAGCRSLYGQAKLAVESRVRELGGTNIRPGLIYGAEPGGMVGALLRVARVSPLLPMIGLGRFPLHTCHEDDLAELVRFCCAAEQTELPALLSAAEPQGRMFRDIVTALAGRRLYFIPVPWWLAWLGLKGLEALGLQPRMKSDSLLGLVYSNPAPDFASLAPTGVKFRSLRDGESV